MIQNVTAVSASYAYIQNYILEQLNVLSSIKKNLFPRFITFNMALIKFYI